MTTTTAGDVRAIARRAGGGVLIVATVLCCGVWLGHRLDPTWANRPPPRRIRPPFDVPSFALRDLTGMMVSPRRLLWRSWILELSFPGCAGNEGVDGRLAAAGAAAWVTLQLDGDSTSAERISAAGMERHVARVDWATLTNLAAEMGLAASAREARDGRLDARHWLFAVDAAGRVRGASDGEDTDALVSDLRASGTASVRRLVPFSGTDQEGRRVSDQDFAGHPLVADFIFTRCRGACPMLTARLTALRRLVPDPDVRFVSFSVDPANDTPAVLKAYAGRWGARDQRWSLLATDAVTVKAVARGLGQAVRAGEDGAAVHSDRFVLIDPTGALRDSFPSADPEAMRRLADALHATPATAPAPGTEGAEGARLFSSLGCHGCHDDGRLAPPLRGLPGHPVRLADGRTIAVDDRYLRESIVSPLTDVVDGFGAVMPSYAGLLSDGELTSLVAYIRALPN